MGVNPDTITMSGQSSGSYMTNHMMVLHSERIKGYGMMEGGPYHVGAIWGVTEEAPLLAMESVANMTLMAEAGKIDDPKNLVDRPAFVLIATNDETVTTNQQHAQNIT